MTADTVWITARDHATGTVIVAAADVARRWPGGVRITLDGVTLDIPAGEAYATRAEALAAPTRLVWHGNPEDSR